MPGWPELSAFLRELQAQEPSPLAEWPEPSHHRDPPYRIGLQPWAEPMAARLHAEYGTDVELTVGALPYPLPASDEHPTGGGPGIPPLASTMAEVALDGDVAVASGDHVMHGLLFTNRSSDPLRVNTNGHVTADVVDPGTGRIVGGYTGAQRLPLVVFRAAPAETIRIPVLIGTASLLPALGFTVPPGPWGLRADLRIGDSPRSATAYRTRIPPLTVTEARADPVTRRL